MKKYIPLFYLFLICFSVPDIRAEKVIILGIDGLDPNLLEKFMAEDSLPNFSRLIAKGAYSRLQTVMSPQSPVAWSTFITGMDPGGHGIFDFFHRDATTMQPESSMTKIVSPQHTLTLGSWEFPLSSGQVILQRKGKAFWEILGEKGISTTVYQMPVNFPPVEAPLNHSLSGMGTPDIVGTLGTFSYYTTRMPKNYKDFSGGKAYKVKIINNIIEAQLYGPENPFRREKKARVRTSRNKEVEYEHPVCTANFSVYLDKEANAIKVSVGDQEFILKEKEWSDWIHIDFEAVPYLTTISSMGRFYLKQMQPDFQLYVTPLQFNPKNPAMPITYPNQWGKDLCECVRYFYTQGIPEDSKALQYGVFSGQDFLNQSLYVYEERVKALKCLMNDFKEGMLFMYFGTVDQCSHMLWRYMDEKHPYHTSDELLINGIRMIYQKMDEVLGLINKDIDSDTTLIVMSDHGFAPFYWSFNLNTWLLEKGYIKLRDPSRQENSKMYSNVDWSRTKAYGLGLNGLYINLAGREKYGIVQPGVEYNQLIQQLERDLLNTVDPKTGEKVISLVVHPSRDFQGPHKGEQSDLLVGYNKGYRCSWESPLGEFPKDIIVNNDNAWSGDHCIDNRLVPGVLITNQEITLDNPALYDLTVAVLDEFGVDPLPEMIGKDCLSPKTTSQVVTQR